MPPPPVGALKPLGNVQRVFGGYRARLSGLHAIIRQNRAVLPVSGVVERRRPRRIGCQARCNRRRRYGGNPMETFICSKRQDCGG